MAIRRKDDTTSGNPLARTFGYLFSEINLLSDGVSFDSFDFSVYYSEGRLISNVLFFVSCD